MLSELQRKAIKSLEDKMRSGKYYLFNDTVEYKIINVYIKSDTVYIDVEDKIGRKLTLDRDIDRIIRFEEKFVAIDNIELEPVYYDNRGWYRKLGRYEGVVWAKGKPYACFVFSSQFCNEEGVDESWYVEIMREKGTENIFIFRGNHSHRRKIIKKSRDRWGFPVCTMHDLFKYDVYKIEIKNHQGRKCYKLIPQIDR